MFRLRLLIMEANPVLLKVATMVLLLLNSVSTQDDAPLSSEADQSALLDLRSSLGLRAKDWPRKADPCSNWTGVECRSGRVVGINVSGLKRTRAGRENPRFAVDALANFSRLAKFNASGFSLPGPMPAWFGQRLSALQVLDLMSCSLTGSIPPSLGSLSELEALYLSDNLLTGAIPSALGNLSSLKFLNLSRNLLTGAVPSALSALQNLTLLDLSSNFLSGPIPSGLGSLSGLQFLNLRNNIMAASVPAEMGKLSQLIELDLGNNYLSGFLPEELGGLRSLKKLSAGNNSLGGSLPYVLLQNLTQLKYIDLSRNAFDGNLSSVLWSMTQLHFLDISGNNFTGVLPNITVPFNATGARFNLSNNLFFGTLTDLVLKFRSIDLSNNYFQGPAPSSVGNNVVITGNCLRNLSNQKSFQDCYLFYAQRGLSFDDNVAPAPSPKSSSSSNKRVTYIVVGLFGGIGFIMLLVLVLLGLLKTWGKGSADQRAASVGPIPGGGSPPSKASINLSGLGESFTSEQMLEATGDFSDTNLMKLGHSGDLFRGILEGGFPVVIKRVDLHSLKKESYMLELEFFSKASHPRLVPLLGHCLENENEKFLVYKYMPHGDLSNSLYKLPNLEDGGLQSLDWITRLKIAIGAAEALCYLHHECDPPIVHRDIQASSILLDDKYEVRLGSLSEVCAQGGDTGQNGITRFLWMPQTSEQGPSGSSSATCAYDVYCFGKVLLQLVTGKLGISKSDDVSTKEWLDKNLPYISINEKEMVAKIVDLSLIVDEDLLEEVWATAIVAKHCLHPKPSRRPQMRHILRALENPLRVVREESYNSAIRTTSSRRSWSAAFFGSWNHSSSDSGNGHAGQANREGLSLSGLKQPGRAGAGSHSQGSGIYELSSSHKRSSSEIFPEPADMQDLERQVQNQAGRGSKNIVF
ncbi:probable LRR receptor-like serine/threonine-protein kinase At2g16250 [Diospyros lotus]|uniref:probable LRR receptor-like serine/threonine-protein kinase At2g16250 n=1 Tax=Diospyros lotus TaxID=55363 RepID=UPI00225796B7|nr:probable LRR receptor-like serine/threonine-protein kinase At2g16250 [Diospyros lotus]